MSNQQSRSLREYDYVDFEEIPPLTREEFYDRLNDLQEVAAQCGGVDPDDEEILLMATIYKLDSMVSELQRQLHEERSKGNGPARAHPPTL